LIYQFIDIQKAEFLVSVLDRVCQVSHSGYYRWDNKGRQVYEAACKARETLKERVLEAFEANRSIYGAPRLARELWGRGIDVSVATVGRLMAELGIEGASGRAKTITTRPDRHARKSDDLVKRNFTVDAVDMLWVSDLTYVGTKEGWLYLVCIMDACSRRILGYQMSDTMDTSVFVDALNQAKAVRGRALLPETIFHSDHGSQYTSDDFREMLRLVDMAQSMGTVGDSFDNAMAESLWASLKKELVYRSEFKTREEARTAIFDWIQWYNRKRLHSSIDYVSPMQFEQAATIQAA
jgi:putative transposase